ncbi:universal stress protein [Bradyrhizobium lablabi]|uniref:universal stress protein n=1 Tax=Bradyrhizobium lablabi TaxID=722472 RepID=UPI001BAC1FC4|nr:universal stress protein [Bradyrhizobium lablabi]MBR1125180.1 universal stress protein [Bradyrhizobium lablabi]
MTYATAMISLAVEQPNDALLEVAGQFAGQFSAKMIGIAAAMFSPPMYFLDGVASQRLIEEGEGAINRRMVELEGQFRAAMHGRARDVEWRSALELPARYVAREARAADLVIVGGDGNAILDPFAIAGPSDLVLQAGRPLLVVPAAVKWLDLRSVLVAWKDCPEARRAVADALPLLAKAKEVTVAGIAEEEGGQATVRRQADDVVGWLSRHGIVARAHVPERIGNAVIQLNRIAADTGAGVVVAGAYGHSRFREWVLGGVTQHLVGQAARCALLSR